MEIGQDIRTSIAMIGAEALDVSLNRIRLVMGDTVKIPDEGYPASGLSLETSGNAVRYAAGIRLRSVPFTPQRVKEALGEST